jgi:ABC-type Mn2+/Zn2+ transport system permease subunit
MAFLNPLALLSAHEDLAHVSGARVRLLNYGFVVLLTLAVSLSIRALGILLVTSMVVLPPAAARVLVRSLRAHVLLTVVLGLVGAVGGVLLSYPLNLPTGPTVTMVFGGLFAVALAASRIRAHPKA